MHFDKILSKHSQGGTGKAGGGAQHPHHPHPHAGRIPEGWGWCSGMVRCFLLVLPNLPAAQQGRAQRAAPFPCLPTRLEEKA